MDSRRLPILHPLASAVLLALSFPPFNFFFPPFVALVPLLLFIDSERSHWRAAAGTALFGLFFWCTLIYWITLFTKAGYLVVVLIMTSTFVAFTLVVRLFKSRFGLPLIFSAPVVWTAASYIHAHGDIAFTWGQLAYSLTDWPFWLQMACVTGPYGVTAWIVAINVVIYELALRRPGRGRAFRYAVALALLFAVPAAFGAWRYRANEDIEARAPKLAVSYVQPSVPQDLKWDPGLRDSTFALLRSLSLEQAGRRPQLVVWPEAATPANLRLEPNYQGFVGDVARQLGCPLLTGSPEYRWNTAISSYDAFNSAFFFGKDGRLLDGYDKTQLVPVSERFPWEDVFPALRKVEVGGSHFVPGDRYTVFHFDGEAFSVLICFESIFPQISRKFVRGGARFLVNITNDAWFGNTSAPYQHLSMYSLRAVENRVPVIRAANTGVSAFIDVRGMIISRTGIFEKGYLKNRLETPGIDSPITFYTRFGNLFAYLCALITSLIFAKVMFRGGT
ncbi:MAG TPA: apolipoprotein N-acyltransferase, partial [Candidatus Glassbacteria bacterium]|nr:apolipoprotein N-acyltransferase [Candidatus Glassbacteria bacterium]